MEGVTKLDRPALVGRRWERRQPGCIMDTGRLAMRRKSRGLIWAMGNDEDVVTWGLSPMESRGVRDREGDRCVDVCRCAWMCGDIRTGI